jgi:hypothetical protein
LAAYAIVQAGLDTGKDPSHVWIYSVSGNYFDVLRIHPYLGRFIQPSDEHGLGSAPYIVLTYGYWHSHFQDDRGVVGRIVQLNKHPFTIIGVAPPEFHGTLLFFSPDFFVPLVNQEQLDGYLHLNDRGSRWVFEVLGHLKPGVTPAQAAADLSSIGSYLQKAYPKEDDQSSWSLVRPGLHGDFFAPAIRAFLAGLMLLAGLILLGACANLGSLFAARAADRGREVALRLALGSSRMRGSDFAHRRHRWTRRQYRALAPAGRVAAVSPISDELSRNSGCKCLSGCIAVGVGKWTSLWRRATETGTAHQSV